MLKCYFRCIGLNEIYYYGLLPLFLLPFLNVAAWTFKLTGVAPSLFLLVRVAAGGRFLIVHERTDSPKY